MTIQSLKPQSLWRYFHALTQIPRPSFEEEAVRAYVLAQAQELGLQAEQDEVGNILVKKPATAGYEQAVGVILQAHLDMVAQKNNDTVHDFSKDPIKTRIEEGWVYATGTTLGADNGIGVAAILAVLADTSLTHGPLEALFTATEETGMVGAKGLRANWLSGDVLLNLDAEEEGELYIGCAGGVDGSFALTLQAQSAPKAQAYRLTVKGLRGGHSGMDIGKMRGNANKLLALLLDALLQQQPLNLHSFQGGSLRNAIPREAQAVFSSALDYAQIEQQLAQTHQALLRTLALEDRGLIYTLETLEPQAVQGDWVRAEDSAKVLALIDALPHGVEAMDAEISGQVATSVNLAQVQMEPTALSIHTLLRSADDKARDRLARRMAQIVTLAGGLSEFSEEYSGWLPEPKARINEIMQQTGEAQFGKRPTLSSIHAGLECGILATNYPHWQMISFGPTIEMPHSPEERVEIASVERFYQWLCASLQVLAKEPRT